MPTAPLKDNPYGTAFDELADDGRRFLVLTTGVSHHKNGDTISAKDLGPGAQIPRLVGLGAIYELSPSDAEAAIDAETAPKPDPAAPISPVTLTPPPAGIKAADAAAPPPPKP
jgi:hypothetical protein